MAFLPYPPTTVESAIAVLKQDIAIAHDVVHGDNTTNVDTESGLVPSFSKLVKTLTDEVEAATGVDTNLRSDITLRDGVKALQPVLNLAQDVKGFYSGTLIGGGRFYFDPSRDKLEHNGGTIIAPEALTAWSGTQADIATLLNWTGSGSGCFIRVTIPYATVSASWFGGCAGEAAAVDHLCVQAALDSLGSTLDTGGIVVMEAGIKTRFSGQVHVKANQTIDFKNSMCAISSSVTSAALLVGGSVGASALTYSSKVLNFFLVCEGDSNIAIRLYGTCNAKLVGQIEGNAGASNRSLGVWIDAGNVSSFFNWVEVRTSHIYEGFRIVSSGTNFATNQLFINCTAFGDNLYGNTTSIGFNFGADNGRPEGQGSVISGGNVEQCGTAGVYISEFAGPVNVQCRFEGGTNTKDIWFKGSSPTPNTVVGAALHNIVTWDSPSTAQTIFVSDAGVTGVPSGVRKYVGQTEFSQSQTFIKSTDDGAGTGYIALQSGIGSSSTGAGFAAYSAAHASFAGDFVATTSGSGVFGVGVGVFGGGGRIFKVSNTEVTAARDNTTKCGSASERFTEVFAVNGTINTSDARDKTAVRPFTAQELSASKLIAKEFGFFKWLDAVAEKGDTARSHCGTTVQRIIEIMESCGLTTSDYGFICYDEWEALEEIRETVQVDVNAEGLPVMQEVVTRPARPAGNRYSLRDGELMKFIAKGFDARLAELEK